MNKKDYLAIGIITLVIFVSTYTLLYIFGFVPAEFQVVDNTSTDTEEEYINDNSEILLPDKIMIPKVGVDSVVQKPQSQDVSVLDKALSSGAVYYPGSGTINVGNMFIFGHSTGFAVVNNQAYKTFNDLNKLVKGDEILIESGDKTFIYKVVNLKLVDQSEAYVDFSKTDRMLTISTCNSFGTKQERWVVEAKFDREV